MGLCTLQVCLVRTDFWCGASSASWKEGGRKKNKTGLGGFEEKGGK
jgi:hypothetical protein